MEADLSNLPEEWLQPKDDRFEDSVKAVFLKNGAPSMIFFTREKRGMEPMGPIIAPMVASTDRRVFLITSLGLGGFLTKAVSLTVRNQSGKSMSMKLPLGHLAPGYDESAVRFFAWANMVCKSKCDRVRRSSLDTRLLLGADQRLSTKGTSIIEHHPMSALDESIRALGTGSLSRLFVFFLSERRIQCERRRRFREFLAPILDDFERTAGEGAAALYDKYRETVRSEGAKMKENIQNIRSAKRAEFNRAFAEFCSLGSDDFAPRHDLKGSPHDSSGLLNPIYDAKGRICRLLRVLTNCTR